MSAIAQLSQLTRIMSCFLIGCTSGDLSASDTSLADLHERQRHPTPELGLMPLPDTDTDSGLDWTHLVDAANAFEGVVCFIKGVVPDKNQQFLNYFHADLI